MVRMKRYIILALLLKANFLFAQDLTGKWEGDLGGDTFIQINIVQVKDMLCGYTWDYLYNERTSFCKAYFTGFYNADRQEWVLTGTSFFASSGDHILMRLKLKYNSGKGGDPILEGTESDPSVAGSIFALLTRQKIIVRKISDKPAVMMPNMKECLKVKKNVAPKPKQTDPKKFVGPVLPVDTMKKIVVPVKPVEKKNQDSLKKIIAPPVPVIKMNDSNTIAKQMNNRINKEMKRIVVSEKNITLSVYDNGIVDNDSVSVFYNGKLLLSHKRLSEKAIVIPIILDEKTTTHEITLFAENLGSIPPNTALIVVTAGDKRYELYASASLTENAVIVFEYNPK